MPTKLTIWRSYSRMSFIIVYALHFKIPVTSSNVQNRGYSHFKILRLEDVAANVVNST